MEDLRSVFATDDEEDVLNQKRKLDELGIVCNIVISDSINSSNNFDNEVGVDVLFKYNLLVKKVFEKEALEIVDSENSNGETNSNTTGSGVEVIGNNLIVDSPKYYNEKFRIIGLIIFNITLAHLPRSLQVSFQIRNKYTRIFSILVSLIVYSCYYFLIISSLLNIRYSLIMSLLIGLSLFSVYGAFLCSVDTIITKNKYVFGFLITYILIFFAILIFGSIYNIR